VSGWVTQVLCLTGAVTVESKNYTSFRVIVLRWRTSKLSFNRLCFLL
jgi:hypothetical protein